MLDVRRVAMQEQVHGLLERIRRCAMPEGAVECRGTWLRQRGEMRFAPNRPWLPFEAEQWFEGSGIDFRWLAQVRVAPLVRARVVDSFERGSGALAARVFGVIPVARSRGTATDKGEALRGLSELPWRPLAFCDGRSFTWEAAAADKLRATFDDGRTQATVEFEVDSEGRVLGGAASSRPRVVGKSVVDTAWSGAFAEYKMFERLRVPTLAEATWHLPEGPFTYWRGRITEFRVLR
jgi:hypothetical protein